MDVGVDLDDAQRAYRACQQRQADGQPRLQGLGSYVCSSNTTDEGGGGFSAKQIRTKYVALKKIWKEWLAHLSRVSGWGRDDDGVPVNTRGVEDEYFREHPECKSFRRKLPPFAEQLAILVGTARGGSHVDGIDDALEDEDDHEDKDNAAAAGEAGGENEEAAAENTDSGNDLDQGDTSDPSLDPVSGLQTPLSTAAPRRRDRGAATAIPHTEVVRRPSATRSHRREDQSCIGRKINTAGSRCDPGARSRSRPCHHCAADRERDNARYRSLLRPAGVRYARVPPTYGCGNRDSPWGYPECGPWTPGRRPPGFVEMLLSDLDAAATVTATVPQQPPPYSYPPPQSPQQSGFRFNGPIDPNLQRDR